MYRACVLHASRNRKPRLWCLKILSTPQTLQNFLWTPQLRQGAQAGNCVLHRRRALRRAKCMVCQIAETKENRWCSSMLTWFLSVAKNSRTPGTIVVAAGILQHNSFSHKCVWKLKTKKTSSKVDNGTLAFSAKLYDLGCIAWSTPFICWKSIPAWVT